MHDVVIKTLPISTIKSILQIDLNRETTDLYKREFVHLKINRELNEIEGEFSSLRKIQEWIKEVVDIAQTSDDNTRGFKGIFPVFILSRVRVTTNQARTLRTYSIFCLGSLYVESPQRETSRLDS
jgi:hypothetical protein